MNKYEMFDALNDYHKGLSHAKSKLYGVKQDNTRYYNRIGEPGNYRYFYTKAEWDAYQEGEKKAKEEAKKTIENVNPWTAQNTIDAIIDENVKKGVNKLTEDIRKSSPEYIKNKAADEAMQKAEIEKWNELCKQNNPVKTVAQKQAEDSMKGYEEWHDLRETKKKGKDNLDRALAKWKADRERAAEELKRIDEEKKRKAEEELKKENAVKFVQEYQSEEVKANSEWLMTDPESELLMATDVINASLFSGTPGEYDKEIDEIYQKIEARKRTEITDTNYDSEGFGLKVKNYELPIEEEIKLVNPGYYYSDSNLGSDITKYNQNCYACTTAMALRKKGYDVTAGTDYNGAPVITDMYGNDLNVTDNEIGLAYNELWTGNFTKYDTPTNTFNKMFSEPVGSYGDFNLEYTSALGGGGHSIFYEVHSDGIHFYDCQIGCEIDMNVMQYYIREARYKRLDNQKFKGSQKMKNASKISTNKVMEEAIKK